MEGKKFKIVVATTSLPAVDRPNNDRWNAARSCQVYGVYVKLDIKILFKSIHSGSLSILFEDKNFTLTLLQHITTSQACR